MSVMQPTLYLNYMFSSPGGDVLCLGMYPPMNPRLLDFRPLAGMYCVGNSSQKSRRKRSFFMGIAR